VRAFLYVRVCWCVLGGVVGIGFAEMVLVGPPIVFPSAALQNYKNNREKGGVGVGRREERERRTPQRERAAKMYLPQAAAKCVEFGQQTHLTACPHPS